MKVLILAYDFPPFVSVGGLRPYSWLKYLGRYGVEPVVITRQWANDFGDERDYVAASATEQVQVERSDEGVVIRTPYTPNLSNRILLSAGPDRYRLLRRLITGWYEIGQYYAPIGPKARLYREALRYLSQNRVDAIVATGDPFVLFRYAADLALKFHIPWVADYRDPWSQDRRRPRLLRRWEGALERRVVESAALISTAADAFQSMLVRIHPGKRIEVVRNGYDPDAINATKGIAQNDTQLTIAFTGSIYGWHPVDSVLGVMQDFVRTTPDTPLSLRMIGVGGRGLIEASLRARFPDLATRVTFTPRLPNPQAVQELARANALLMFNMYANPGTKVYDYLGVGRRILLCYSDDPAAQALKERYYNIESGPDGDERVLERMVAETRSGVVVRDAQHLRDVLSELSREFLRNRTIACESVGTERYSREAQAGRFAELLKGLAK